ncbi:MAG TPA: SRPBCC domain-containing protein [Gemmatimonadales bacterium]|nr:SRPBCC domain-containing protein [Gemmatimonadales bacterium]
MKLTDTNYTTTFTVDQTPRAVFDAINHVRGWWSGVIAGDTDKLGAEFTYRVPDIHYSRLRIVEFVPGKRVVWHVLDSDISYTKDRTEWNDTSIIFDIVAKEGRTVLQFTHVGLVPADECYDSCSDAWRSLINGSLRQLIVTGEDQPDIFATSREAQS